MAGFDRITVRSPRPFDVVGDSFILCGLGRANEGVIGTAVLTDKNGAVLDEVSPMLVPNSGFLFSLFDFPVAVGAPATPEGVLTVEPITQAGCRRAGIAQDAYGDANLWPRLFVAKRDIVTDPDLIRIGQVLRVPIAGP